MDNRIFSSNISDSLFNTTLIVTTILVREGGTCSSHQLLASPALRGGLSWNIAACSYPPPRGVCTLTPQRRGEQISNYSTGDNSWRSN